MSSPASNADKCFSEFIGQRLVGVLFDALPVHRRKTLIFEDGRGLTITSHGTFWIDSGDEVQRGVRVAKEELERTQERLNGVLELAGP